MNEVDIKLSHYVHQHIEQNLISTALYHWYIHYVMDNFQWKQLSCGQQKHCTEALGNELQEKMADAVVPLSHYARSV